MKRGIDQVNRGESDGERQSSEDTRCTRSTSHDAESEETKTESILSSDVPEDKCENGDRSDEDVQGSDNGFEADSDDGEVSCTWEDVPYKWVDKDEDTNGADWSKLQDLESLSRSKAAAIVYKKFGDYPVSNDSLKRARRYINNPTPREIRVVYDHRSRSWAWNNSDDIDELPYLITQLNCHEKGFACALLRPAPHLGDAAPYPTYNFELDTLILVYPRCGSSDEDKIEMETAINCAADAIKTFVDNNPHQLVVKRMMVTYCIQPNRSDPAMFIRSFVPIHSLGSLDLETHYHWDRSRTWGRFRSNRDDRIWQDDRTNPAFRKGTYKFEVTLDGQGGH